MDKDIDKLERFYPVERWGRYVLHSSYLELARRLQASQARVDDYENELNEELENRDRFEEVITDCAALFGDYEWVAKIPPDAPPNSGDLTRDLPELISRCLARVAELEEIYEAALGLNALDMGEYFEVNYQRMETLDRALEKYFETNRSINQRPVEGDKP